MLVLMNSSGTREDADRVISVAQSLGLEARPIAMDGRMAVEVIHAAEPPRPDLFECLSGVARVLPLGRPLRRVLRGEREETVVRAGSRPIGGGAFTLIAGPCAVEGEAQLLPVARAVQRAGAHLLRGGAYKLRSSPYDFQGLGEPGLKLLARAREETGLPVITEAVDESSLGLVERYADVVQIGARNMSNYALLKLAGRSRLPVLIKRGMSASLEELLLAAEYVLEAGNPQVMLCERGIRTFSAHSRFTLDLSIVPLLKRVTHLPILVDPSHASGHRESVGPLARAALAAGADGVMVEVHADPLHALCDGPQALLPDEFASLAAELRNLAPLIARQRETVS